MMGTNSGDAPRATPVVLAVGFCASCCVPLTNVNMVRKQVDGEQLLFCSERCIARYTPRHVFHW